MQCNAEHLRLLPKTAAKLRAAPALQFAARWGRSNQRQFIAFAILLTLKHSNLLPSGGWWNVLNPTLLDLSTLDAFQAFECWPGYPLNSAIISVTIIKDMSDFPLS